MIQHTTDSTTTTDTNAFLMAVRRVIAGRVEELAASMGLARSVESFLPGKMLRTRLAARLVTWKAVPINKASAVRACASVEMVHTASLLHDDVIDHGNLRRGRSTLWRLTGPSAAVLVGDMLICDAMSVLLDIDGGRYGGPFTKKIREVCAAEAEQELSLRGRKLDEPTCLRIARGKTGSLFAFVAAVCGCFDGELAPALEEAGYHIGTAYQLADDLVDVVGSEEITGKTLGTDSDRRKFTLPETGEDGQRRTREHIYAYCNAALECLNKWPLAHGAVEEFLVSDLYPVLAPYVDLSGMKAGVLS